MPGRDCEYSSFSVFFLHADLADPTVAVGTEKYLKPKSLAVVFSNTGSGTIQISSPSWEHENLSWI